MPPKPWSASKSWRTSTSPPFCITWRTASSTASLGCAGHHGFYSVRFPTAFSLSPDLKGAFHHFRLAGDHADRERSDHQTLPGFGQLIAEGGHVFLRAAD